MSMSEEEGAVVAGLIETLRSYDHFAKDEGQSLYRYRRGVYRPGAELDISEVIGQLLAKWNKQHLTRRSLDGRIIHGITQLAPRLWEQPPLGTVNLRNGLLDIRTRELQRQTADYLSPVQLPIHYDPEAQCPAWDGFLAALFQDDPDGGAETTTLVYELLDYLLEPDTSQQKAVLFVGAGDNGKSALAEAIQTFIGEGNYASKSLEQLMTNRFAAADLVGKLVNICADIPTRSVEEVDVFKAIVGGDTISAERKFKDPFAFKPFARLVFSANNLPHSRDGGFAWFKRWIVIPFEHRFVRGVDMMVSRSRLIRQLSSRGELSGVLNKVLDAGRVRRRRRAFMEPEAVKRMMAEFIAVGDPVELWLRANTIQAPDAWVSKAALLDAYNADHAQRRMPDSLFARELRARRPEVNHERRRLAGGREWVWSGIALRRGQSGQSGQSDQQLNHVRLLGEKIESQGDRSDQQASVA